jgi:arabinofuranan 3-O-arabinosyltransferase
MTSQAAVPAGTPTDRLPAVGASRPRGIADHWWFLLVWVTALLIFTSYHRGQIGYDTKLGVDIDPVGFLSRLWPLWNPLEWFGSLQDQYIGYAIPMAPFYLVCHLAHLPVWLTERVWLSVLVTAAFAGVVRLAAALRIGSPGSRLLAGAAFALWPTFTIAMGSVSAAALPGIMMPWAVLPLTRALRGTSSIWRAAARSGVAIALMGGVNATSTLAVLVLPAVYILTGTGHDRIGRRLRLGGAWLTAVLAATAWWALPLLLQGRYSFNFLPYIEQSATTSKTMSASTVLRGAGTWTAYLHLTGLPWIRAGWLMVTAPLPVLAASAVAASGLAGLARRDMPERRWLTICVGITALITMIAYYGPLSGPLSGPALRLMDGPLAPLRSTYKFEPVAAAALSLACAHVLSRLRIRLRAAHRAVIIASAAVITFILGGLALPQLTGQMSQGTFTRIPAYWYRAAGWLSAHSPQQTALVVPADPHAQFLWGTTDDDPLEPLASSPWTERGIVPYGGAGSQQLLETIESAIESGSNVPGLALYLERAGIRYVVVRNDLSPDMLGYTPAQNANETLAQSGFGRVASFGPLEASAPDYPQVTGVVAGYATSYPAVEVFQATDPAMRAAGPVSALDASSAMLVNGGVDSLLQLGAQGLLTTSVPAVLAGDSTTATPLTWAVTDGQRRADNEFGATSDYASYTYTATGVNPAQDPLGDPGQPPRQILPVPAAGHQTVAMLSGAASVTASSAGSWLSESQQYDPVNAFDGDPSTAWAESSPATPVGQWVQIDFGHPVRLGDLAGIRLLDDSPYRALATQLAVTTAAGTVSTAMKASGGLQSLRLVPGTSRWLRITITGAINSAPGGPGAGISDVLIPGITVTKYLQPAQSVSGAMARQVVYSFQRQPEESRLARTFTTPAREPLSIAMTAQPVAGPGLDALIAHLTAFPAGTFQATASSSWSGLAGFGADGAFTGSAPWIAAAGDRDPAITLRWHGVRTIRTLQLIGAPGLAAVPVSVVVSTGHGSVLAHADSTGTVRLAEPVRTTELTLGFPALTHAITSGSIWQPAQLPVGLSKIVIPGLHGLRLAAPDPGMAFHLACGAGTGVRIDGVAYRTSVDGTVGDLLAQRPVRLRLCGTSAPVGLSAGRHYLIADRSGTFALAGVALSSAAPAAAVQTRRQVSTLSWGPDSRTVGIGPGASSYLEIHENYNSGWDATLGGQRLRAVVLDGWQQGFVVPAGRGGVISLGYTPAGIYHAGLIVSAVVLLGLLVLALARPRRPRPAPMASWRHHVSRRCPTGATRWRRWDIGAVGAGGAGRAVRAIRGRPARAGARYVPVGAVIFAVGGVVVIGVPVLAAVAAWRPRWMPFVAGTAMAGAGITAATAAQPTALGSGAFSGLAQGLALVALTAAIMPYPRRREAADHADALQRDR